MTTVNDITDAAYRKCGISDPTSTEDANALIALNNMMSIWGPDFAVPSITQETLTLVSGQAEYTIGPSGDLDTVKPLSIANAYLVDSNGYSYPLREFSAKDYNDVSLKTLEGRPTKYYFIPTVTQAKVIFNKEADAAYTVHFEFWKNFTEFSAISDTITLPPEYKEALVYGLAVKLAEENSIDLPKSVYATAASAAVVISRLGAITRVPKLARFDMVGGTYNITTDEWQ